MGRDSGLVQRAKLYTLNGGSFRPNNGGGAKLALSGETATVFVA